MAASLPYPAARRRSLAGLPARATCKPCFRASRRLLPRHRVSMRQTSGDTGAAERHLPCSMTRPFDQPAPPRCLHCRVCDSSTVPLLCLPSATHCAEAERGTKGTRSVGKKASGVLTTSIAYGEKVLACKVRFRGF